MHNVDLLSSYTQQVQIGMTSAIAIDVAARLLSRQEK